MTPPPPAGRPREPREVKATVDLSGLHPKAIQALAQDLFPGEIVTLVILGERDQAIIGTRRRAFVFKKGGAGGALFTTELISWDYAHLTGVTVQTGEQAGAVMLEVSDQVPRPRRLRGQFETEPFKAPNAIPVTPPYSDAVSAAEMLRAMIAKANAPEQPVIPASAPAPSPAQELHHLAQLRDLGVISDEEFQIMKARIVHGS